MDRAMSLIAWFNCACYVLTLICLPCIMSQPRGPVHHHSTGVAFFVNSTTLGERMQGAEEVSTGLLTYPVLMAADILLYQVRHFAIHSCSTAHHFLSAYATREAYAISTAYAPCKAYKAKAPLLPRACCNATWQIVTNVWLHTLASVRASHLHCCMLSRPLC